MNSTMNATLNPSAAPATASAPSTPGRRIVDAPTRMFHWLFALSFAGAWLTAESEHWRALHVTLGYTLAGLLAFRLLYGLIGPRHARIGLLWRKLGAAPAWLRTMADTLRQGRVQTAPWRQGQNLLMAAAVFALLALVLPLTLSGYATYNDWGDALGGRLFGGDGLEDLHEFFANAFLAVVLGHIGLIVGLSLLRRKNQARPMLSGRTDGAGPDLVKHNHAWLAVLLLVAVITFIGWQWQQSPQGLIPTAGSASTGLTRHDDPDGDDD